MQHIAVIKAMIKITITIHRNMITPTKSLLVAEHALSRTSRDSVPVCVVEVVKDDSEVDSLVVTSPEVGSVNVIGSALMGMKIVNKLYSSE